MTCSLRRVRGGGYSSHLHGQGQRVGDGGDAAPGRANPGDGEHADGTRCERARTLGELTPAIRGGVTDPALCSLPSSPTRRAEQRSHGRAPSGKATRGGGSSLPSTASAAGRPAATRDDCQRAL